MFLNPQINGCKWTCVWVHKFNNLCTLKVTLIERASSSYNLRLHALNTNTNHIEKTKNLNLLAM